MNFDDIKNCAHENFLRFALGKVSPWREKNHIPAIVATIRKRVKIWNHEVNSITVCPMIGANIGTRINTIMINDMTFAMASPT